MAISEDTRRFCQIIIRCAKMLIKLLEDFMKEG